MPIFMICFIGLTVSPRKVFECSLVEQISVEVIELEKKIAELKLKLNLGEKTDYKSQKKREF